MITTVAGTGSSGYSGDGGPATAAQIATVDDLDLDLDLDAAGNLWIFEGPMNWAWNC